MTQLKNLLAATDFSSPSRQAADRAARLAVAAGAQLKLVHALSDGALAQLQHLLGLDTAVEQTLIEQTQQSLEEIAADLSAIHAIEVKSALIHGAVLAVLTREAEQTDTDLIVLGARGTNFMRRFVLGSTVERLLRKTRIPMLVVKQRAREPYRRALVAIDFSDWSLPLLDLARRVAPGANLVLLNACDVPFEGKLRFAGVPETTIAGLRRKTQQTASEQLSALAERAGLKPEEWSPSIPYADASLAIVQQEQDKECDLIVIGKHGQNKAEELLLGSVTKHVLTESTGDVLVSNSSQP